MADIAIQPIWQVLDGNGNPYPAARATFFLSGTSTPLTVYTDIGLTVAHPVPVVADANGVFPPVYLGSAAAKAVITTSTGAAIKTVDPVPKTTASSTGAAQVSFAPTAAIPSTTVQAAIEQVQANLEGSSTAFVKTLLDDTTATAFMTTLGGTAAGQAVFTAADAAAQRATLGAMPVATATSGPGKLQPISSTAGVAVALPASGTWAYYWQGESTTTGVSINQGAGVAAGGSSVGGPFAGVQILGWAWRID